MDRRYFGTDGVRGRVGQSPMTPDFLVRLGYAAGKVLAADAPREVLISKDTRRSGYMVESALEAGLSAAGVDILLSGPLPTSAVSYLTQALRLSAGVVISASHNPHDDNGVKFFGADGHKLPDALETRIEESLENDTRPITFADEPGKARRLDGAAERYIEFCKRAYPPALNLRDLRIVVDCANGAAYHVAPPVFHELGADVVAIGDRPDGLNINVACGALAPDAAQQTVTAENANVGVVLDGDADRVLLVDETGKLWDGDALLYLIAEESARRGAALAGVVGTVLSNLALERRLQALGIAFHRAGVGDRYVNAEMLKRDWRLGGEPSGHIVLRDYHLTGDGIIAALQVLAIMRQRDLPLSALLKEFQYLPQESRNLALPNHRRLLEQTAVRQAIAAVEADLGKEMRLVVRPSGTEAIIRLMVEGEDRDKMNAALTRLEEVLVAAAG